MGDREGHNISDSSISNTYKVGPPCARSCVGGSMTGYSRID